MTYYTYLESPVDRLLLTSDGARLTGIHMLDQRHAAPVSPDWTEHADAAPFPETIRQLEAYFAGELTEFDLPLAPVGTDFQLRVWRELERIPYGETISYGELARRIGNANASRAVGLANGRNPLPIVVPCHRVIGTSGKLVGFGGGLDRKQRLLSIESLGRLSRAAATAPSR